MIKTPKKLRPLSSVLIFVGFLIVMFIGYGLSIGLNNIVSLHWIVLIGIFFNVLFRPSVQPLFLTLILGLFVDGFESTPFGFYALGFLLMHQMIYYQRRFLLRRPFNVIWAGFMIDTFVMGALLATVMWIMEGVPTVRLLISLGVLWAVFPVCYMFMNRVFESLEEDK